MAAAVLLMFALLLQGGQPPASSDVTRWIGQLGAFEFPARTEAARSLRRAPLSSVVGPLESAARRHQDEYVRFRAFVLLSALDEPAADRVALDLVADRNDRLRTAVYQWFEHHRRPAVLPRLIEALPGETSEFVRPALTRALAAYSQDARAQAALAPLVMRGEDLFRGAVIVALGDYGGRFALDDLLTVARTDGPLQDDAVTAIGRLGDVQALPLLRDLQASAPRDMQPTISAAVCLLGQDCEARLAFLSDTLKFSAASGAYQPLLRGTVHGLGMLAQAGHAAAFDALVDAGVSASATARPPIALGVGTIVLRDPAMLLAAIDRRASVAPLAELLRDAFDMLAEDFEEERFGMELRRVLWSAPEGSPRRRAAAELAGILEF